jgi:hypothetical protein
MRPLFNTRVATAVSLNEFRASFSASPIYQMKLSYDVLRDQTINSTVYDEWRPLIGFFLARQGKFDSFLYEHPDDHTATAQSFGTGDGLTANFSLVRTLGSFTERVANVNVITEVSVNNTPTSNYTISSVGTITFNTPPADAATLDWTGTYYYRCRFTNDEQEFNQFMSRLWDAKSVELLGCLGTKL